MFNYNLLFETCTSYAQSLILLEDVDGAEALIPALKEMMKSPRARVDFTPDFVSLYLVDKDENHYAWNHYEFIKVKSTPTCEHQGSVFGYSVYGDNNFSDDLKRVANALIKQFMPYYPGYENEYKREHPYAISLINYLKNIDAPEGVFHPIPKSINPRTQIPVSYKGYGYDGLWHPIENTYSYAIPGTDFRCENVILPDPLVSFEDSLYNQFYADYSETWHLMLSIRGNTIILTPDCPTWRYTRLAASGRVIQQLYGLVTYIHGDVPNCDELISTGIDFLASGYSPEESPAHFKFDNLVYPYEANTPQRRSMIYNCCRMNSVTDRHIITPTQVAGGLISRLSRPYELPDKLFAGDPIEIIAAYHGSYFTYNGKDWVQCSLNPDYNLYTPSYRDIEFYVGTSPVALTETQWYTLVDATRRAFHFTYQVFLFDRVLRKTYQLSDGVWSPCPNPPKAESFTHSGFGITILGEVTDDILPTLREIVSALENERYSHKDSLIAGTFYREWWCTSIIEDKAIGYSKELPTCDKITPSFLTRTLDVEADFSNEAVKASYILGEVLKI